MTLTPREIAVLAALRHGDRASVADGLGCSLSTLDKHLASIRRKLGVDTNLQAYALVFGHPPPPRRPRRRRAAASAPLWEKVA